MLVLLGAVCGIVSAAELPEQEKPGSRSRFSKSEQPLGDMRGLPNLHPPPR